MSDYKYSEKHVPQEIETPGYSGPDRRSGKHSPYGDGLFGLMRANAEAQIATAKRIDEIADLLLALAKGDKP